MSFTNKLIVDLNKIEKNLIKLKNKVAPSKYYAVVKADAYGLGAAVLSKNIEALVDGFCVSSIWEGVELREAGIKKDILLLGYIDKDEYKLIKSYNITVTIYNFSMAEEINDIMEEIGYLAPVHIKLDTGHGRLGFLVNSTSVDEIDELSSMKNLKISGIYSHFSTADEKDTSYSHYQMSKYIKMIEALEDRNVDLGVKHIANDAGFLKHNYSLDMVRSGISLYGIYPSQIVAEESEVELEVPFQWTSKVSHTKYIEEGDSLSYGRTFIADRKTRVATVSIGYADGYKRSISNKGYVLIRGKRAPIIGNISMDQMMVDISWINNVERGDVVTLVGKDKDEEIKIEQLAKWSDTIAYEIMTSISSRVKRIYI